ncbi:MAG: MerR family transcriptional regulator [Lachnospiraceae bacterium]|nr:MerR family transcriptional regulator [Lachnospiraceae bacterium]
MTIKEVEQELGIPRATIRFYEKEKLISPTRTENDYRDYSREDVTILKKIIVLRKIGISVSDIKELLNGEVSLSELVEKNILQLEEQIKELEGALRISKEMQSKGEEITTFDEDYYLEEIGREEKAGNKFLDITSDILKYEKKVIFEQFDIADNTGNLRYGKVEAFFKSLVLCICMGITMYLIQDRKVENFIYGFTLPFVYIISHSIVGLPLHFFGKKYPKAAERIRKTGLNVCVIIVIALAILGFTSQFWAE